LPIHPPIGLLTPSNKTDYDSITLSMIQRIIEAFENRGQDLHYPKILRNHTK
jgi:hypothetical protein